jgi:hypothetical protein
MAEIIPFPVHRTTRVFPDRLPADSTPYEEAIYQVRTIRAERYRYTPAERQHHVAIIKLDWWEGELARIVAARRHPAQGAR